MKVKAMKSIVASLKNKYPFMFADGANENEMQSLVGVYKNLVSPQYREFLKFSGGAIIVAYPVYGVNSVDLMDSFFNTVVKVTNKYEDDGVIEKGEFLVISENHAGDPICLNVDGQVIEFSHDGSPRKSWVNFNDFVEWCADRS